jgi:hypothetical protein
MDTNCDLCSKAIAVECSDDIYADEAGTYHPECHADYMTKEGEYWARVLGVRLAKRQ